MKTFRFIFCLMCLSSPANALDITTTNLPVGTEALVYSTTLTATNGTPPYAWSLRSVIYQESSAGSNFLPRIPGSGIGDGFDNTVLVSMPFDFPFYGFNRPWITVDNNGKINMGFQFNNGEPGPDLNNFKTTGMIAPLWSDLSNFTANNVFIESGGSKLTVTWQGYYSGGGPEVNFSADLFADGMIAFHYGAGNTNGGFIGISAGDSLNYIISPHSESGPMENAADILFIPETLQLPEGLALSTNGILSGVPVQAGTNSLLLQVDDGNTNKTNVLLDIVILPNSNRPPQISMTTPPGGLNWMGEQTGQTFSVTASDPEGSNLTYNWFWNGAPVGSNAASYTANTVWGDAGDYSLRVDVTDGLWSNVWTNWTVRVVPDNDFDGIPNEVENMIGFLNPWDATDGTNDPDGDFLGHAEEYRFGTDLLNPDTDGDGLVDGWEICHDLDPNTLPGGLPGKTYSLVADVNLPDFTRDVFVEGNYAYLINQDDRFFVVDVSNPNSPMLLDTYDQVSVDIGDLYIQGNYAYLAVGPRGLVILDVSNPLNVTLAGEFAPTDWTRAVHVVGSYAYLGDGNDGLRVIDVSNPALPFEVGSIPLPGFIRDVFIRGSTAYVAYSEGLSILDISTPSNPMELGRYELGPSHTATSVQVAGDYAYLNYGGFRVLNVSNPTNPVLEAANVFAPYGWELHVSGSDAFRISSRGLSAYDIQAPANPQFAGFYPELQPGDGVFATGSFVFAADAYRGLMIIQVGLVDTDRDDMDDDWERSWWGDLTRTGTNDFDLDGIPDAAEYQAGMNPTLSDQDGDGLIDGQEVVLYNTDPRLVDSDNDGIDDGEEVVAGSDGHVTDPNKADTDGDLTDDKLEIALGRNPVVAEPSYAVVFFDDMESGLGNWQVEGPGGLTSENAHSGSFSWTDSPWGNDGPVSSNASCQVTLKTPLDLSGYAHAWLSFSHVTDRFGAYVTIELSTDSGSGWTEIDTLTGVQSPKWDTKTFGISQYTGSSNVLIRFQIWGVSNGWYLDDVRIYAVDTGLGGTVTGEGTILENANVKVRPRFDFGNEFGTTAWTDSFGDYDFDLLVPGDYIIKADGDIYAAEYYNDAFHRILASPVTLTLGSTETIDFDLVCGVAPGFLTVSSLTNPATVYLNFEPTGQQTPAFISDIAPGSHFVWVSNPAFPVAAPQLVGVEEADTMLALFDLDAPSGSVRVESAPQLNAMVYLNFQPTGLTTPALLTNLAAGTSPHFLSVEKSGFISPEPQTVVVDPSATNPVQFILPAQGGASLRVTSSPTGGVVALNYRNTSNRTDNLFNDLAVGSHFVRVSLPGLPEAPARGIQVATGETAHVHFQFLVLNEADADGDGLPDIWESVVGLDPTPGPGAVGDEAGSGDKDGDGLTNQEEFNAGTSPTDAGSVLKVSELKVAQPLSQALIEWQSMPGKRYQIEYNDDFPDGTWFPLGGVFEASDFISTIQDLQVPSLTSRHYRVVVFPKP